MLFMSPDDGAPEGGNIWAGTETAPTEPSAPPTTPSEPPPEEAPETPPAGDATSPAPAQPASDWTPERVAEMLKAAREPQAPVAPPQMSQEEIDRLLNKAQVGPEDVAAILEGGENAVAALGRVIQAAVLEARTTAWYQTQMLLKQQQDSLEPVIQHYHQAEQDKLTNQFFGEHKEFQPDKHMKLLAAVKTSLDAEQAFKGKSRSDGFKLIAERAKELLSASGTPLVPVVTPPSNGGGTKMAQLSRGAGHGAAAPSGAGGAPSSNTAKRFFGP